MSAAPPRSDGTHQALINGAACRFRLSGGSHAGANPVLLIHELGGSLESWEDLLALMPQDRPWLRYDLRGAGLSEKVTAPPSLDLLAEDCAALLDHAGFLGKVTIVAAAAGAAVALRLAVHHPGRVAGLWLLSPSFGVGSERRKDARALCRRLEEHGMAGVETDVFPAVFPPDLWRTEAVRDAVRARWRAACPLGYAAMFRTLIAADLSRDIAAVPCNVQVLAGRHDPFNPPRSIRHRLEGQGAYEVRELEAGHFMAVQSPHLVAPALKGLS